MKKIISALLILTIVFGLIACDDTSDKTNTIETEGLEVKEDKKLQEEVSSSELEPELEQVSLNVAYMPNYASMWAMITAIEMGYFEEENLKVVPYEFSDGPTEISAMESGSIDICYIGTGAHKLPAQGVCKIIGLSEISDNNSIIGLKSRGVYDLEDLAGKKVGYASGTSSETLLTIALESIGLTMDDIIAYDMDTSNMVTAMVSGNIDACATWSPNTMEILSQLEGDAVEVCSNIDFIDKIIYLGSFVVMDSMIDENRDVLVRFMRALLRAMDYASKEEHFTDVSQFIADQLASDFEVVYAQRNDAEWMSGKEQYEAVLDGTTISYYETIHRNLLEQGHITEDSATDEYIDLDILIEAGESLYE